METYILKKIPIRIWLVVNVVVIMLLMLQVTRAQDQIPKIASSQIQINFSELNKSWFQAVEFLNRGAFLEVNLKLRDLNQKKFKVGLKNLSAYSAVLIKKAHILKDQGMLGEAIALLESAKLLSPDVPAPYFALARFRFAQDVTDVYKIGREIWYGLRLKYRDVRTLIAYVNNALSTLLLAGILTSIVFILFSFVYYRRAIFYQIKTVFPIELPDFIAHLIGWVLLVAVTLGLGISWGGLLLAFFLIWHVELTSKRILQFVLCFGGLLTVFLIAVTITFSTFDGEYFQTLREISYGEYSSRTVPVLQERLNQYPNDAYAMFGLAYMAQKTGNIEDAIEGYTQIPVQYPDRAAVQNNLGNLYQHRFRTTKQQTWYQQAEEAYRAAISYAPKMFEPHYNLGQLLLLQFAQNNEADTQLLTARKIDNNRFVLYSDFLGDNVIAIDAPFSPLALLKKLYAQDFLDAGTALAQNLWESGSRFKNPWYFSAGCGILLLFSLFFGVKKGTPKQGILYCQMCGDPYTVRHKKSQEKQTFCTQCTYIFKKKTVVKPEKRAAKVAQIHFRQKIRGLLAKVASLILPGAGQIYLGYITKGVFLCFFFFVAVVVLVLKGNLRVLLDTGGGEAIFSWPALIFLLLLLVGIYIINIYDILRLAPRNQ